MSEQGPKLYATKPKRTKLKQLVQHTPPASTTMASSSSSPAIGNAPPPPTPKPPPVKESFARRYKFLWPLLLAVNFTVGAYLFTKTRKKDVGPEETVPPNDSTTPTSAGSASSTAEVAAVTITNTPVMSPVVQPVPRAPIPEDQQRELFKWILEEERKVKPRNAEEKKRIDEEKAILKQFIRAKSLPSL